MRADLPAGTMLAGHRVEGVIGRGGVSVVYLAEHLRLGRLVALKLLSPHLSDDVAFRERFIRESRIAAGLDHPSIVTVFDAGEADGFLYLSMRYIEGLDLGRRLRKDGALPPWPALTMLLQIAEALDAAHEEGLVHRDVKPGNVLLSRDANDLDRAFLSDFGVTKRMSSGSGLTRTGQFVGTVDFVAPEQIQGRPVDGRADMYSLGCVVYACLTGEVPFPRDSEVATIYGHLQDPPPRVSERIPELADLDPEMARALAKDPVDRFASCREMILAMRDRLHAPTEVRSSPMERVTTHHRALADLSPTRRSRGPWVAIATALVLVVILIAGGLFALRDRPRPSPSPSTTRQGPTITGYAWTPTATGSTLSGIPGQAALWAVKTPSSTVAVGYRPGGGGNSDAGVWRSDGTVWTEVTGGYLDGPGEQRMASIVRFRGRLIAVGWSGTPGALDPRVWTSADDGATWDLARAALFDRPYDQVMQRVVVSHHRLVAVGFDTESGNYDPAAWTSSDGVTWARDPAPVFHQPGDQHIRGLVAFGSGVVAVGMTIPPGSNVSASRPAAWLRTAEGWRRAPPMTTSPAPQIMNAVIASGGHLVAVGRAGDDAAVWTSPTGIAWTREPAATVGRQSSFPQEMYTVARVGGLLLAGGDVATADGFQGMVWTSTDGASWSQPPFDSFSVTPLGGPGDQSVRYILPISPLRPLAFGLNGPEPDPGGVLWAGRPTS